MEPIDFRSPVTRIIARRCSRRSFKDRPIDADTLATLRGYCTALSSLRSPFGDHARFGIIDRRSVPDEPIRLGTYGMLKNPRYFLFGVISESKHDHAAFGYLFEHVILKATDLGFDTCWLGYFKRSSFLDEISPAAGEVVPAVSPVGYASDRRSIYERVIKSFAGPKKRKPWDELFFSGSFGTPLDRPAAGAYSEALDMVRLAPSAGNLQPWRVVMKAEAPVFMFYLDHRSSNRVYEKRRLPEIDIGIAMCHFDLVTRASGLRGSWLLETENTPTAPNGTEYVLSWSATAGSSTS